MRTLGDAPSGPMVITPRMRRLLPVMPGMRGILFTGVVVKGDVFSFVCLKGRLDQRCTGETQQEVDGREDPVLVIASLELETNMNSL